ncbi:MAG TPA: hypothetical protein VN372_04980 [Methanospirillum sp.]|nr:hypothetical protein [Methanospirillum sp.]
MPQIDLNAIMKLKRDAMKRCQERILEEAAKPPDQKKKAEEIPECYGITQVLKKRHGL